VKWDRRRFVQFSMGLGSVLLGQRIGGGMAEAGDGAGATDSVRTREDGTHSADKPVVFWACDPVGPDQTLMMFGHGLRDGQVRATRLADTEPAVPPAPQLTTGGGERLPLVEGNAECLKASIPESWKLGLYAVWVETPSGAGLSRVLNRAETWWLMGERGRIAGPHDEVRVFGKNFRLDSQDRPWRGRVMLRDQKGKSHPAEILAVNKYALTLRIPDDVPEGEALVFVHNGWGGAAGWSTPLALAIRRPAPWPQTVFNVRDFGAQGDGLQDDTAAFQAALRKCEGNGGGVVFLPRGVYRISSQLTLPRKTILRGERREVVWLLVPMEAPQFNTVLAGSGEFGVEDLSMVAKTPLRMITAPDVKMMYTRSRPWGQPGAASARDVFLRRLRLHHLRYSHRIGTVEQDPRRAEVSGPSTVALAGERLEVSDCEIISPGMPLIIHRAKHARILRNVLRNGRNGWVGIWGATESLFEGNIVEGGDLEASYCGFGNFTEDSGTDLSRLYIAENRFLNGFGDEREALAFDDPGRYPWVGRVHGADSRSLAAEEVAWKENELAGLACLIVAGKGLGQHRRIVSNDSSRLTLNVAWDVIPDSTSVAAIKPFRTEVVVYHNHSQDTSVGVQLWAGGYNFIIDGNTSVRTGGFWGTAAQYIYKPFGHLFLPCYFTQWLENEVSQGFVYQQGPEQNGSAAMGFYLRDVPAGPSAGVLTLGNVFRRNKVRDNTHIGLSYFSTAQRNAARAAVGHRPAISRDTVIEENSISDAKVGIDLEAGFDGVVVRHNRFERVVQEIRRRQW
jgi:hypothetical protein